MVETRKSSCKRPPSSPPPSQNVKRFKVTPAQEAIIIANQADDSRDRDSSPSSAGPGNIPCLPDDSIEDIVSRLPVKDVLRFGCVSKSAGNLISRRGFIEKHMKRWGVPMIVVMDYRRPRFLVDKLWDSNRRNSKAEKNCHLHPEYDTLLSQEGLIVSTKAYRDNCCVEDYIIFNPIYSETVEISVCRLKIYNGTKTSSKMLGVFYRPCVKEYSTLWEFAVHGNASRIPVKYSYKVLDLRSQSKSPEWRNIKYPFCQYHRFCPRHDKPVLINGFLYWVCKTTEYEFGIMVFDTNSEGFELIPSPETAGSAFSGRNSITSLLNGNGVLNLVQILVKKFEFDVNIWALAHGNKIWSISQYRMISRIGNSSTLYETAQIIALWNGELVLEVEVDKRRHKEILVCNLKLGTTRKFGRRYPGTASFMSHVMSLARIKNLQIARYLTNREIKLS